MAYSFALPFVFFFLSLNFLSLTKHVYIANIRRMCVRVSMAKKNLHIVDKHIKMTKKKHTDTHSCI